MITNRKKLKHAMPVIIGGAFFAIVIIWGTTSDYKCKKLLEKKNCIEQMVFCKYSKKTFRGSGNEVSTGFVSSIDTSLMFTTQAFLRPLPKGFPMLVRYSQESEKCCEFLWDSTITFKRYKIRYFHIQKQGMDFEVTKIKD